MRETEVKLCCRITGRINVSPDSHTISPHAGLVVIMLYKSVLTLLAFLKSLFLSKNRRKTNCPICTLHCTVSTEIKKGIFLDLPTLHASISLQAPHFQPERVFVGVVINDTFDWRKIAEMFLISRR